MDKKFYSYQDSGNNYNSEINRLEQLEKLEKLRNEVHMTDHEYNIIKDIINGKDEPYNSTNHLSKEERLLEAKRSFKKFLVKLHIIFGIFVLIILLTLIFRHIVNTPPNIYSNYIIYKNIKNILNKNC